jgi:hypothetical protein
VTRKLLTIAMLLLNGCRSVETRQLERLSAGLELRGGAPVTLASSATLRTPGWFNELCVQPLPPFVLDSTGWKIRAPDGHLITLRVVLRGERDTAGLVNPSYSYADVAFFCLGSHDSLQPPYQAVELLADRDVSLGRIEWRSYDK